MSLMRAAETANPETQQRIRFRYWPLAGMAVLIIAAWVPYFLRIGEPERVMALQAWGGMPDGCYVVVDGNKLQHYSEKYNIYLACGLSNPALDQGQDTEIAISSPFTIAKDPIAIKATYPSILLDKFKTLATSNPPQPSSLWHTIFLFPKKGDISRIKRTADVREFGGKLVNSCEPIE